MYLAGSAVARSLVGALGVGVVGSHLIRGVGPSELIRASAIRAVPGLEKLLAVLYSSPNKIVARAAKGPVNAMDNVVRSK